MGLGPRSLEGRCIRQFLLVFLDGGHDEAASASVRKTTNWFQLLPRERKKLATG